MFVCMGGLLKPQCRNNFKTVNLVILCSLFVIALIKYLRFYGKFLCFFFLFLLSLDCVLLVRITETQWLSARLEIEGSSGIGCTAMCP